MNRYLCYKFRLVLAVILALGSFSCFDIDAIKNKYGKKENLEHNNDTTYINGNSFKEGLSSFNDKHFSFALYLFEEVRSSDEYYNEAQKYIKITKDSLKVYQRKNKIIDKETIKLIYIVDEYCRTHKINRSLLFDSLIAKDIIGEDELQVYFQDNREKYADE